MANAALIVGLAMLPMIAHAQPAKARSRTGHVAEIKTVAEGSEALFVDGREVWREDGPLRALPARNVCWLDSQRVAVGETELEPKLVVGWEVD
jgi:hypothetical protein